MSFSSINAINVSRMARKPGQQPQMAPQGPPGPQAVPMQQGGAQQQLAQAPVPVQRPAGMMGTPSYQMQGMQQQTQGGVQSWDRPPQQPTGPQAMNFDPNDPANAALAGYMNGV